MTTFKGGNGNVRQFAPQSTKQASAASFLGIQEEAVTSRVFFCVRGPAMVVDAGRFLPPLRRRFVVHLWRIAGCFLWDWGVSARPWGAVLIVFYIRNWGWWGRGRQLRWCG